MFTTINQREFFLIPHPACIEETEQHDANMVLMEKKVIFPFKVNNFNGMY